MAHDGSKRGPWSQAEDRRLLQLINAEGPQNWVAIAQELGNRSAKQCRERYHQNLKPGLNHSPITQGEAQYILAEVDKRGPRWADISRELGNNRSDNSVKNWWNGYTNRKKRQEAREAAAAAAAGRPSSRDVANHSQRQSASHLQSVPHSHQLPPLLNQRPLPPPGPAALPSPTDIGFSPRTVEAPMAWPRDPLPPSPASIASDRSATAAFSSQGTSTTLYDASTFSTSPRYHAPPADVQILPPIRSRQWEEKADQSHSRHPSYEQPTSERFQRRVEERRNISSLQTRSWEYYMNSNDKARDAYDVPRSEQGHGGERQYYHSHQLPPLPLRQHARVQSYLSASEQPYEHSRQLRNQDETSQGSSRGQYRYSNASSDTLDVSTYSECDTRRSSLRDLNPHSDVAQSKARDDRMSLSTLVD